MIRFEMLRPSKTYKWRPGAYGILTNGDDILLTRTNEYQLPGGGVDPGETEVFALRRECMEETGWTISNPIFFGRFDRFVWMPEYGYWARKICAIYCATPLFQAAEASEPDHIAEWMPINDAIKALASHSDKAFLKRFKEEVDFRRSDRRLW